MPIGLCLQLKLSFNRIKMRKDKIIYWVTTSILGVMMLFSGYAYFTNPDVMAGFIKMGFPDYFRMELGVAKILAAAVIVAPQVPSRIKEWGYAGLGITFISAIIAHLSTGDRVGAMAPLIFLGLMAVSYGYREKLFPAVV